MAVEIKEFVVEPKVEKVVENGVATIKAEDGYFMDKAVEVLEVKKADVERLHKFEEEYVNKAFDFATKVAEEEMLKDKSIKEVVVELPYGSKKKDKIVVDVIREKTFPVPGKDEKIRKTFIDADIEAHRFYISKKKRKEREKELTEKLLGE